jgi:uncharacterized membrane protein YhaH (DUF805 family)
MSFLRAFVGFDGRIGRLIYFLGTMLLLVLAIALAAAAIGMYGMEYGTTPAETRILTLWSVAFELVLLYPMLTLTTKRLHDLDLSGWWNLAFWLPSIADNAAALMGLSGTNQTPNRLGDILDWLSLAVGIAWLALCLIPGTRGANRFGPDPSGAQALATPAPGGTAA